MAEMHNDHEYDPDGRFCCKIRYMKTENRTLFSFGRDGRKNFHGDSIAVREKRQIAELRSNGIEPERI